MNHILDFLACFFSGEVLLCYVAENHCPAAKLLLYQITVPPNFSGLNTMENYHKSSTSVGYVEFHG